MKTLSAGLLATLLFSAVLGQKSPIKFGDIPMEDLKMTSYDKDSSAAAVVLTDYGEAYIQTSINGAFLTFERHLRIKILTRDGAAWANAVIPLYHSGSNEERVISLKAATYNLENGKVVESKMSKESVFKEKFNRYYNHQKFTLPDVREGSVIEYSYKITSDFLANFPNWQFQTNIPTRHSEYWAIIPDVFTFEKYMQGYIPVTFHEVKNMNVSGLITQGHHYISKDVPAFKEEPFMTSEKDYVSKLNFALAYINVPGQVVQEIMGTWEKLNTRLLEDEEFFGAIRGSGFLKSTVTLLTAGKTEPLEQIAAIHHYVKNNILWDGYSDYYADNLKKVMDNKKGSSGDINLLLASMLEKAGFEVDMVLLSTRDHGFVREQYPMARQFNYVVCAVRLPDKTIMLDATEKYIPINVLPERCLNGRGLVISKKNHGWMTLDTKTKSKTIVNANFDMDETGSLKGKIVFTRDGYDANRMRSALASKGQQDYLKDFLGAKAWQIEKSEFQNIDETGKAVQETHELSISDHASVAGNNIYFNPFVALHQDSNPFRAEQRVFPVDYGSPQEKMYICRIKVPEGYVLDEAPVSKIFVLPGNAARYAYNVSSADNWISITSSLQINRNIFSQLDYPDLREFYSQVVAKQAEQFVFKKKL